VGAAGYVESVGYVGYVGYVESVGYVGYIVVGVGKGELDYSTDNLKKVKGSVVERENRWFFSHSLRDHYQGFLQTHWCVAYFCKEKTSKLRYFGHLEDIP
jgi:hypothetical protein